MFYLSPARLKKIVSYLRCNENIRDNIWDYPDTFYGCSSFCMSTVVATVQMVVGVPVGGR